jgi:hypothetical protein
MLAGNSIYGARWGYSINLNEIHHKLVPCGACQGMLFQGVVSWNVEGCSLCSQWEMLRTDTFLCWKAPKGFPLHNFKEGLLRPLKIDYGILIYAATHAHDLIVKGDMSKVEAEMFLSYYCVNTKTQVMIVRNALNMRTLNVLGAEESTADEYQTILDRKNKYPHEFERWKFPSFWKRDLPLKAQIDAPMHLVFLGAVQGVTGFIHTWLRKHEKYSNFMRLVENRLSHMVKFKLNWLKILPYKGDRLGGWVSENYVSFAKLCKWFYLILDDVKEDKEPYQDPGSPQNTWLAMQNRAWLKARGLQSDGKAAELKERVAAYLLTKKNIPLLPPPGGTMEDLHLLVDSMYEMVKSIMVFEVNDDVVRMADYRIKRFLTHLVDCDRKINPGAKVPFWISSYTYPCLLNIPGNLKAYGPMKNLWEGGVRGEGSLRYFKPLHANLGLKHGWEVQIMNQVYQKKGLRAIGTSMEKNDYIDEDDLLDGDGEDTDFYAHDGYWKYPNADCVYQDYKDSKPMCLVSDGVTYGAMIRNGQVVKLLIDTTSKVVPIRGMHFQSWKLDINKESQATRGLVLLEAVEFTVLYSCVLLPVQLTKDQALYAAVRDDYTMMDGSGDFN